MRTVNIKNEKETRAFGLALAKELKPGAIVALVGDLGTGKTTLTRYIAEGLGILEPIQSPTFTIIREHRNGRLPLFHFDVYRLEGPEDLFELGYEDYFFGEGVTIVEWADKVADLMPEDTLWVHLDYLQSKGQDDNAKQSESEDDNEDDNEEGRTYTCTF
jgi:tRNA threonylcarbamoyladenosine biosynthesis protein TsaE